MWHCHIILGQQYREHEHQEGKGDSVPAERRAARPEDAQEKEDRFESGVQQGSGMENQMV